MALTYAGANALLNILCGKATSIPYSSVYVGLGTNATEPARDGTGFTEPSGNGYARQLLGNSTALLQKMGTPSSGSVTNNNSAHEYNGKIYFPEATGSWGSIKYVGLFSAATGGTLIAYAALTGDAVAVASGTNPVIPASSLTLSLT